MTIHETLAPLTIPLGSVTRYPGNARAHQLDRLRESLRANQQYRPIVVNRRTMQILAGNGTHEAAEQEGWTEIAATFVDVDDEQAQRILLVDNPPPSHPGYDDALLLELLQGLPDIGGTGWTSDELAALEVAVRGEQQRPGFTDPDEVPEPPVEPVTRPGDLWLLGDRHRVFCGDATKRDDVRRLLDGKRPDLMLTDPPYGVIYGGDKTKNAISGDLSQAVIPIAFAVAVEHLAPDARLYLFGGHLNWAMYSGLFDHHLGMQVRPIVWVKDSFVLRHNGYHSQFELVYFGWKGKGGGPEHWYGERTDSDVWQVARDRDGLGPTQKPVEVCAIPIRNSCPPGSVVYEPFAGSGSTLIAAHGLGRACYALDLEPSWVDVTCRRWQESTGVKPVLEATGEPHDFTEA